jgi:proline dehydrogenase
MEKERARASRKGYEDPIQPNKEASDLDFNQALEFCVDHMDRFAFCCGSHNEYSSMLLTELMKENDIAADDPQIYFSQLLGMSDHISFNLAKKKYNVAKYVPYGPVKEVMPYLIRRSEENSSIAGQTNRELDLIEKELERRGKEKD